MTKSELIKRLKDEYRCREEYPIGEWESLGHYIYQQQGFYDALVIVENLLKTNDIENDLPIEERVHNVEYEFTRKNGRGPTRLYLGHDEYNQLRACAAPDTYEDAIRYHGLEFFLVEQKSHLHVC